MHTLLEEISISQDSLTIHSIFDPEKCWDIYSNTKVQRYLAHRILRQTSLNPLHHTPGGRSLIQLSGSHW